MNVIYFWKVQNFQGEISKIKVRFGGNHDGKKIMKPWRYKYSYYWRK